MDEIQVVSTKILCLSSTRQIRPRPKTSTHGAQVSVGFNCAMSLKATRANRILGTTLDGIDGDCDEDDAYESFSDLGEIRVYRRADFQSGSRVLKKVF